MPPPVFKVDQPRVTTKEQTMDSGEEEAENVEPQTEGAGQDPETEGDTASGGAAEPPDPA
jgi:hypothetical protein